MTCAPCGYLRDLFFDGFLELFLTSLLGSCLVALRAILGLRCAILGPTWPFLGANMGSSWAKLGYVGPSCSILCPTFAQDANFPKTFKNNCFFNVFEGSGGPSWGYVGPCCLYVGLSWVNWRVSLAISSIMLVKMAFSMSTCRSHVPTWLQHGSI